MNGNKILIENEDKLRKEKGENGIYLENIEIGIENLKNKIDEIEKGMIIEMKIEKGGEDGKVDRLMIRRLRRIDKMFKWNEIEKEFMIKKGREILNLFLMRIEIKINDVEKKGWRRKNWIVIVKILDEIKKDV